MQYKAGIWRGNDVDRPRWGVLGPTGCWDFAKRYGRKAAEALADRLNREVPP